MSDHVTTTRRTLLAGTLSGAAAGGLMLAHPEHASAAVSVPTDPSSDFFLAVAGIGGESTDERHPGTIAVLDWSFGAHTTIGPTSTGRGRSKSHPKDFNFVSRVNKASPTLFKACATGRHIPKATLTARRGDAKANFDYLVVTLQNVYVSSYSPAPSPDDGFPLDVVTMEFGAVEMSYTPQTPNGAPGTPVVAGFDFIANKSI